MGDSIRMVCLANSEKHGDRCLAGVRINTGGWLRPVSDDDGSGLLEMQYETVGGHHPEPLDIVSVKLDRPRPKYHQPENWVISGESWELIDTELDGQAELALNVALQREGHILCNTDSKIPKHKLKDMPVFQSLTLVSPSDPDFYVHERDDATVQPRTTFDFGGHEYDFPITDPRWRQRALEGGSGSLPSAEMVDEYREILFTISLGEEYKGHCYKIVAAIFAIDSTHLIDF